MSVEAVVVRIAQLQSELSPRPVTPASSPTPASPASASQFSAMLGAQSASALASSAGFSPLGSTAAFALPGATSGAGAGAAIVQAAAGEVGQAEQPPGSNDSPRIAGYRAATGGAGVGPWCAYFASWAARQAGTPLGEQGQGFGSVSALFGWAQRTGRAEPPSARPNPGDLIVWGGEHIGVVEGVGADGSIHTIEGNSSNAVTRRTYGPDGGGATGYVRLS